MRGAPPILLMLTAVLAATDNQVVHAQPQAPRCAPIAVYADASLTPAWQAAVLKLRDEVAALPPGECTANRLWVTAADGAVLLLGEGADGRTAQRSVPDPSQLSAIALGLLASIPSEPPATAPFAPAPAPNSTERAATPAAAVPPPHPTEPAPAEPSFFAISIAGGARLAEPTHVVMADLELRADAPIGRWIVLAAARFAPFGVRVEGAIAHYAYDELALGAGIGRRFSFGEDVVDLSTMPTIVIADEEALLTGAGGADPDSLAYLRWNVCARWLFAHASSWRLGTALEVDVAPTALDEPIVVAPLIPPIPTWSVAVHFVASGELQ
jgi:hypothetical protein